MRRILRRVDCCCSSNSSCDDERSRAGVLLILVPVLATLDLIHIKCKWQLAISVSLSSQKVEPGLEQSEAIYSLTYVALFVGHTLSAVAGGLLFYLIPTWYLFPTLCHILGYLLYALATSRWMMILARGLAGMQQGSAVSIVFSYFAVSFNSYMENLKILGKFEEKKVAKRAIFTAVTT